MKNSATDRGSPPTRFGIPLRPIGCIVAWNREAKMEIPEKSGPRFVECLRRRVQENRWKNAKTGGQRRHHIDESLIAARPEFAARLMDHGAIADVSRPIRIRRHDKSLYGMEAAGPKGVVAAL